MRHLFWSLQLWRSEEGLKLTDKKLVEIITVLYSKSSFALLDEPFSYLSPVLVEKIIPHIKLQSKLKGIILTEHQYRSVFAACDRYYILSDGALNEIDKVTELEDYGYLVSKKGDEVG